MPLVQSLADTLVLGSFLDEVRARFGGYDLLAHWQQGEFHHDVVLRVNDAGGLPGPFLVVATNCNGGIKEVLALTDAPDRGGLWKHRCPDNDEFTGAPPSIVARAVTVHWRIFTT